MSAVTASFANVFGYETVTAMSEHLQEI
jgi:hypothetical protein